jgi:hypothetical protein
MKILRALPLLFLLACGGDDDGGGGDPPDAQRRPDAERPPDAEPPCETGAGCLVECDLGAPALGNQFAARAGGTADSPNELVGVGLLNDTEPFDVFQLEFYRGFGGVTGGIAPGTYPITGDELNYSSCGVCPRIFTDCTTESCAPQQYYATGGSITVTQVNPNLVFTASNLTFVEVTIADDGTFTSTPVPNGCQSEFQVVVFDAIVEAGATADADSSRRAPTFTGRISSQTSSN